MRLVALAALLAAPALAQPVTLAPGHPDLAVSAVTPASGAVAVQMLAPQAQVIGTVRDDVRLDGGVLSIVTSSVVGMAGPPVRDSTQMAWPSLAPVAHVSESGQGSGAVAFAADSVRGEWAGAPLAFALDRPVFASAALPYVVRALPLERTGYRAVVPLYSARERFQEARLTVVGPDTVTVDGRVFEAVVVEQAGGGGLTRGFAQRHFVDPATREIVVTTLAPQGMSIEVVPLAADVAATVRPIRARAASPVALVPGHPDLVAFALSSETSEMRRVLPERRPLWAMTETVTHADGLVTIAMDAHSLPDAATTIRDTTRLEWPSLRPVSHTRVTTSADGDAVTAVAFDGQTVTGEYGPAGAERQPLDLELREPVFGPRTVPILARALPFRAGYTATVPTFSASDRLQERTLIVVGRETVETPDGPVSAWIVEEEGDGPTRIYAVHPETRALLSTTYSPSLGALVETVRQ